MAKIIRLLLGAAALVLLQGASAAEEDGYDLWLRYRPVHGARQVALAAQARSIVVKAAASPTVDAAVAELQRGLQGTLGRAAPRADTLADGALVLLASAMLAPAPTLGGTPRSGSTSALGTGAEPAALSALAALKLPLAALGKEGYLLRATRVGGKRVTLIAANSDIGLLYGAFAWLRAVDTGAALDTLDEQSAPKLQLRVLNHWDNLDRTVERGYAGESIWNWWALPEISDRRYVDYARANASLGINGTVLNNVNAKPDILTAPWIAKAAALAGTLRPYGIKVYLSVRFSTPLELGETDSADPLSPAVAAWWARKADEIYRAIPDFGGFLIKANSEGQPGPQDYHRNHAEGANMLSAALAPHHGVVMWRAFVYAEDKPTDRARQAFDQFKPLDGKFADNVLVQVKNGAIDFQPREPFHPLFGAMPRTPLMMEFQITKEYLGFSTHLAYLGALFEETLRSDTHTRAGAGAAADEGASDASVGQVLEAGARAAGSTVATSKGDGKGIGIGDGDGPLTGMAGVANIGSERTWSGSHFDQANWYAYGRLAWNPQASSRDIAREWAAQTFSTDAATVQAVTGIMMMSREAVVDYMTPLGLHHLMGTGHHHGPAPWVADLKRPEWNPAYYHQADRRGIGFDRTASGSDAVGQYAPALARQFADPHTTPEKYLLWFHHLPWDYRMASGRTLWNELVARYDAGVLEATDMQARWQRLQPMIDARRHADVAALLAKQLQEAIWWRDASIAYFQSVSGLPLAPGVRAPALPLEQYKALRFPYAPGRG